MKFSSSRGYGVISSHPDSKMEELLEALRKKYWKARGLIDRSFLKQQRNFWKVEAQTILSEMKYFLSDILKNPELEEPLQRRLLGMLIITVFDIGMVSLCLGDVKDTVNCLNEVLELIPDKISRPSPDFVLLSVEARNVLGAEYVDIDSRVAVKIFDEADKIYYNYRKVFPKKEPLSYDDHFLEDASSMGDFQLYEAHSLTKFYLRQFSHRVNYFYKSLADCYETLRVMATSEITDLTPRAEISILLGEYFINEREFHHARYVLSIASYIIDKYEENIKAVEAKLGTAKLKEIRDRAEEARKLREEHWMLLEDMRKETEAVISENEVFFGPEEDKKEGEASPGENETFLEGEEARGPLGEEAVKRPEPDPSYKPRERKYGRSSWNDGESPDGWMKYKEPTVREVIKGWKAFLARAWVKYGLHLMKFASQNIEEPRLDVEKELPKFPKFKNLDISGYEKLVTDQFPKNSVEASRLFLFTQRRIMEAQQYYTLSSFPHEHVALAQEHSLLIRYMMKYENDGKSLRKHLKSRIRMLEPLSLQLNYKDCLHACRLLWFELGKCYHELLLLKYETLSSKGNGPFIRTVNRINDYCSTGMVHLHNYIDSFRNDKFELPDPVPPEAVAKLAFAHFHLGRMYHAYITFDQEEANEYTLIAFSCFQYVVKNCEEDETVMEAFASQYEMLKSIRVGSHKEKLLLVRYKASPKENIQDAVTKSKE